MEKKGKYEFENVAMYWKCEELRNSFMTLSDHVLYGSETENIPKEEWTRFRKLKIFVTVLRFVASPSCHLGIFIIV